jgi:hypothetical protein
MFIHRRISPPARELLLTVRCRTYCECTAIVFTHFARTWARSFIMRTFAILAALTMFAASLAGCHASASVDPKSSTSIVAPR